ncbi:hypothetical protein OC835_002891 [Tilletia horrida]|nr:hypothetical protein OC835_002891 [Tilletia horrida]
MPVEPPNANYEWISIHGRLLRCLLCTTTVRPSDVAAHEKTRRHQDASDLRQQLEQLDAMSDSEDGHDQDGISGSPSRLSYASADSLTAIDDVQLQDDDQLGLSLGADDDNLQVPSMALPNISSLCRPSQPSNAICTDLHDTNDAGFSDEDGDDDDTQDAFPTGKPANDQDYRPFPSRLVFLLYTIASNPRSPMSRKQIKLILLLLRWIGVKDTPSYSSYQKAVKLAQEALGGDSARSREVVGCEDHHFVVGSVSHELARDFAIPDVRKQLTLYPREDNVIVDMMDASWVGSLRDDRAPPMAKLPDGTHAYVEEPVELEDYRVLLVSAWFERKGRIWGRGRLCVPSLTSDRLDVIGQRELDFAVKNVRQNGPGLAQMGYKSVQWKQKSLSLISKSRKEAHGRPVYSVFLRVFCDDLSGVKSKRWDKHHGLYFQNGNLSKSYLGRDASIKLFCASPAASAGEMMEIFVEEVESLKNGFECIDSLTGELVLIRPTIALVVCDNPMAAELVGLVGMNGNFPCRACVSGGDSESKATIAGMKKILTAGSPRTTRDTKRVFRRQLFLAASGRKTAPKKLSAETGSSDPWTNAACSKLQEAHAASGAPRDVRTPDVRAKLKEAHDERPWAALLDYPGFEPYLQMPIELLHVVLLGLAKYLWRSTMHALTSEAKLELAARLTDANIDGLGLDGQLRGGYLVRHAQSLNGKDFRALLMVVPSILPAMINTDEDDEAIEALATAWLSSARLAAALFVESVARQDVQEYKKYVERCINAVYWSCAQAVPSLLASKPKLHLLLHAPQHFDAFGPLCNASAERFEAFNAIVRSAAIHSNRLHPSRDIGSRLFSQQDLRFVLSGWKLHDNSEVGQSLRVLLASPAGKVLQEMYGVLSSKTQRSHGVIKASTKIQSETIDGTEFRQVRSITLPGTGDVVTADSAILASTVAHRMGGEEQLHTYIYLVQSLLASTASKTRQVVRALPLWPRPGSTDQGALIRSALGEESETTIIGIKDVVSVVNIQHDCKAAGCRLQRAPRTASQKRSHPGDDMEVGHSDLGLYTASLSQFRSSFTIWRHISPDIERGITDIARTVIEARARGSAIQRRQRRKEGADGDAARTAQRSVGSPFSPSPHSPRVAHRTCAQTFWYVSHAPVSSPIAQAQPLQSLAHEHLFRSNPQVLVMTGLASTLASLLDDPQGAHDRHEGDEDETMVADEVEFTNPHAHTFIAQHPLSRKCQHTLDAMIRAFEMRAPDTDLEPARDGHGSFAPLHVIYGYGLMLAGMSTHSQALELAELKNEVKELKASVQALASKESLTFNAKAVNDLAAKIFFSGIISDYAAGKGSTAMEKAGMIYLRKRPGILGANGKTIMMSNNTTAWKAVKTAFHQKFTNLRNHVKSRLPLVLGKINEEDSRNAYETLQDWFKNYGIDITEYRVYRVVLLRALAQKQIKNINGEPKLPESWWTHVSEITTAMMRDAISDEAEKADIVEQLEQLMRADQAKYGAFDIPQDEEMVKAERELDACIAEAQGFGDGKGTKLLSVGSAEGPSASSSSSAARRASAASSARPAPRPVTSSASAASAASSARPAPRPVTSSASAAAASSTSGGRAPSSAAVTSSSLGAQGSSSNRSSAQQPSSRKERSAVNGKDATSSQRQHHGSQANSAERRPPSSQTYSRQTWSQQEAGSRQQEGASRQQESATRQPASLPQQEIRRRTGKDARENSSTIPSKRVASAALDAQTEEPSRSRRRFDTPKLGDDEDEIEVDKSPMTATRIKKHSQIFDDDEDDEEDEREEDDEYGHFDFGPVDGDDEDYGLDDMTSALASADHGL